MSRLSPFFFEADEGYIFCQRFTPEPRQTSGECLLILAPFAEEMNKSRRMLAQQAWRLADHGFTVYLPDLFGTGDSEGDFADATWMRWQQDIERLVEFITAERTRPLSVLALRMGALLLGAVFRSASARVDRLALWQPASNGELVLNQFYRLKLAADMMAAGEGRTSAKDIKQKLAAGEFVEIAGYTLNPELVKGLGAVRLEELDFPATVQMRWFELVASAERDIPPASARVVDALQGKGYTVHTSKLVGPQFWSAVELVDVPELLDATVDFFVVAE